MPASKLAARNAFAAHLAVPDKAAIFKPQDRPAYIQETWENLKELLQKAAIGTSVGTTHHYRVLLPAHPAYRKCRTLSTAIN